MTKFEDYLIPGTNILKNKLGIENQEELTKEENENVIYKLSFLYIHNMKGEFDSLHLCNLHRFLFSDIYEFAGCYREVNMFKKAPAFLDYSLISSKLNEEMNLAKYAKIDSNNKWDIACFLGNYYSTLIYIHPFREGNGRTIREFMRQFTLYKFPDYYLDLTKLNKKNLLDGIIERETYPSIIAYEFYNALTPVEVKKSSK